MLTVTLHWGQGDADLSARVSLVTPSNQHPDLSPPPSPLAQASAHVEGPRTVHALAVPPNAASGVYYLTLRAFDGQDEVRAIGARGHTLGTTYLRPVWIDNPRPAGEDEPYMAHFGDRVLLRDDVQVSADDAGWEVLLTWQATRPIPANYAYSLRVLTADGTVLAQRDLEGGPGYGFWPTSAWRAGEWLTDRVRMAVPAGARAKDAAAMNVVLYDRAWPDAPGTGSVVVPMVEREHTFAPPPMEHPVGAQYGDQLELLGYDLGVAITGHEDVQPILIMTEGFGEIAMAAATFDLLAANAGRRASANGATQIRAGVLRPEVIIPAEGATIEAPESAPTEAGLMAGRRVRIIRQPGFGRLGVVRSLPAGVEAVESEAKVRVVEIAIDGGEVVTVPRANVEAIES